MRPHSSPQRLAGLIKRRLRWLEERLDKEAVSKFDQTKAKAASTA